MRNQLLGLIVALGLGGAGPGMAQSASATVVRDGDAALTCHQMADEAAVLSADMGDSGGGLLGRFGEVARAGAAMVVPGAGLVLAGADAVTSSGRERREAKADASRDRWNYLNGLYAGKGCGGAEVAPTPTSDVSPPEPAPTATPVSRPRISPTTLMSSEG